MRINPRVHEEVNEEWLSDKSRNSYDGLKRQRLTTPLRRVGSDFEEITWERALAIASEKISNTKGEDICASVG